MEVLQSTATALTETGLTETFHAVRALVPAELRELFDRDINDRCSPVAKANGNRDAVIEEIRSCLDDWQASETAAASPAIVSRIEQLNAHRF